MADGDYERRGARDAEIARFQRILAAARASHHSQSPSHSKPPHPMKILVVGSGGREHAITWRLSRDAVKHSLFCAPGNAGTASIATNLPIGAEDIPAIVAWAQAEKPDLVVVGPEAPLVKGLVDELATIGVASFGRSLNTHETIP